MVTNKRYSTLLYSIYEMNEIDFMLRQACVFLADFETLVWADSYYLIEEDRRKLTMNVNGIGTSGYPAWYRTAGAGRNTAGTEFSGKTAGTKQAAEAGQPLVLHGKNDADEGETAVGSSVNAQTGVSIAVYKPQDFDESNPVYHVKTWDADGNMTERMVNISEIDPRHCDEIEMSAYTWYLSNSGKCPNAFMNFAGAKAYNQANPFEKTDWVSIIKDYMQMQYDAGNMKGYLDYKRLLGFITCH